MKFTVQVIVYPDDDTEASPVVREVFTLDRDDLAPDTLGLQLAEAKDLLAACKAPWSNSRPAPRSPSRRPVRTAACLAATKTPGRSWCAACSARCGWRVPAGGTAAAATILPVPSSRWPSCCLSGTTPELAYLQARHGHEPAAAEPADLPLDPALLMGAFRAGLAVERLDPSGSPRSAHKRCTCIHRAPVGSHATVTRANPFARACATAQSSASPSRNAFTRTVLRASTRTS
jgi:hypothetical protein